MNNILRIVKEAAKNLGSKVFTLIPRDMDEITKRYWLGRPILIPEKCNGCSICAIMCPVKAINMVVVGERVVGKRKVPLKNPKFDYNRCIYCGLCSEVCKFGAIKIKKESSYRIIIGDRSCYVK